MLSLIFILFLSASCYGSGSLIQIPARTRLSIRVVSPPIGLAVCCGSAWLPSRRYSGGWRKGFLTSTHVFHTSINLQILDPEPSSCSQATIIQSCHSRRLKTCPRDPVDVARRGGFANTPFMVYDQDQYELGKISRQSFPLEEIVFGCW